MNIMNILDFLVNIKSNQRVINIEQFVIKELHKQQILVKIIKIIRRNNYNWNFNLYSTKWTIKENPNDKQFWTNVNYNCLQ